MQFRKDINGLRAIAVLPVILFHFNPAWAPGGFSGVDIFFVISGYLMTGIIVTGIEENNFSLSKFYIARAKRILPALTALCAFLLIFGWFYLVPDDYRKLGKHVASTISFLSNFIYWRETGYFNPASQEKWLLHSWSLSVEWQFYMLYPLVLLLIRKFWSNEFLKKTLLFVTLAGYLFSVFATYKWTTAAYFLLPARGWELTLGGLAFLYPFSFKKNKQKMIELIGIILILFSCIFLSKENVLWPGYLAIIPSMGAFFIIQAQRTNSLFTTNTFFQQIGTCSYSLYLWHWPFAVVIYYFSLPTHYIFPAVALSVIFAYLSNRIFEQRKICATHFFKPLAFAPKYIICTLCVLIASLYVVMTHGANDNSLLDAYLEDNVYPKICHVDDSNYSASNKYINCRLGNSLDKPVGLLLGDSYAGVLDPFIDNILKNKHSFISRSTSHCFPSSELDSMLGAIPAYCKTIREKSIKEIQENKYDVVFLAGRWENMYSTYGDKALESLFELIDIAVAHSKLVYLVEQPIYYTKPAVKHLLRSQISPICSEKLTRDDALATYANNRIKTFLNKKDYSNLHIITRDILYGAQEHSDFTADGFLYTYDNGHLSLKGSIAASNNFMKTKEYIPLQQLLENKALRLQ